MGGGNSTLAALAAEDWGLSPRGRGKPAALLPPAARSGSIPAWAGETLPSPPTAPSTRVYPRVGGGNPADNPHPEPVYGLSPRGRGKHDPMQEYGPKEEVYPRVGGGNRGVAPFIRLKPGLSPRGRGKPAENCPSHYRRGSIPAWAGETTAARLASVCSGVYPRVGGGNRTGPECPAGCQGLSPRGRGKRWRRAGLLPGRGSIPAWAGETPAPAG